MSRHLSKLAPFALVAAMLLASSCITTQIRVEYRDGYFVVTGLPEEVKTITFKLSRAGGQYRTTIVVAVEDGRSERICLGQMYRGTYAAGEISVIVRNEDDEVISRRKNKESTSITPTSTDQEIPWDAFGE